MTDKEIIKTLMKAVEDAKQLKEMRKDNKNTDIYNMKLHESIDIPSAGLQATRVASGWIYRFWNYEAQDYYGNYVFVPYDNAFQGKTSNDEDENEEDYLREERSNRYK